VKRIGGGIYSTTSYVQKQGKENSQKKIEDRVLRHSLYCVLLPSALFVLDDAPKVNGVVVDVPAGLNPNKFVAVPLPVAPVLEPKMFVLPVEPCAVDVDVDAVLFPNEKGLAEAPVPAPEPAPNPNRGFGAAEWSMVGFKAFARDEDEEVGGAPFVLGADALEPKVNDGLEVAPELAEARLNGLDAGVVDPNTLPAAGFAAVVVELGLPNVMAGV